ncbi:MAG: IS66 family insertion sequence element accessory protein TnpB [Endozoicomonas sp.]|uniref:IS66 family insertion sequence element accessory protein TnpB n=1 Tax=Endozoicomonas sp. TaxID=1892382 RepID=UPI003D9B1078
MFFPESGVRAWLCTQPTDMRKSYDGLSALAKNQLQEDPLSGQLFVFINRKGNQVKILYFDRSGYCIWSKRLKQGTFRHHWQDAVKHLNSNSTGLNGNCSVKNLKNG